MEGRSIRDEFIKVDAARAIRVRDLKLLRDRKCHVSPAVKFELEAELVVTHPKLLEVANPGWHHLAEQLAKLFLREDAVLRLGIELVEERAESVEIKLGWRRRRMLIASFRIGVTHTPHTFELGCASMLLASAA